jgi:hypothetical protein
MTPWKRTVALAAVGCLIAGAALAQQQIRPPNMKSTPQAPNTPLQAPSHWGPPLEQPKEPETTQQKPPKPPKPPVDAKKKPREDSARLKGEADVETGQHALE